MSEETKPWYMSKGVIGGAGAIIAGALGLFNVDLAAADIQPLLISAGTVVTGILALIGRLGAKKKLTS